MPKESMKSLIQSSIANSNVTEVEIATWVADLRRYHDEETKRQQARLEEWGEQDEHYALLIENFNRAYDKLEAEHQAVAEARAALTQERAAFAEERRALAGERQELARERAALERAVDRLGGAGCKAQLKKGCI